MFYECRNLNLETMSQGFNLHQQQKAQQDLGGERRDWKKWWNLNHFDFLPFPHHWSLRKVITVELTVGVQKFAVKCKYCMWTHWHSGVTLHWVRKVAVLGFLLSCPHWHMKRHTHSHTQTYTNTLLAEIHTHTTPEYIGMHIHHRPTHRWDKHTHTST